MTAPKKRGQIDNFERKLEALIHRYGENIQGYFYFIDESLNKNQNYYKEEIIKNYPLVMACL